MQPENIAGRYTVLRPVGRGGMGTVWLCRDDLLGRQVAVKEVGRLPGESTSDVDRALREARSSAALNHPNVVSIYDAVEDGEHNWLVMEFVESRTLAEILAEEGPMSPERATWIGLQAAEGLAAAHDLGTMHRDVKPGNVLVTADDRVKITDFGLSRTHGDTQLTQTGLVMGTPAYFAPEIARGEEPDLPADVWALGATLYAAVEGAPPYPEQANALALLSTIATTSAPYPRRAGLLTESINRMLDRDPTTRWTMDDVVHSLRRLHEQELEQSAGPRDRTVALAPLGAGGAAAGAGAAGAGASDAAGPDTVPRPTPTRKRPVATPPPDERRRRGWLLPLAAVLLLAGLVAGVLLLTRDDGAPEAAPGTVDTSTARERTSEPASPEPSTPEETVPAPSEVPEPEPEPEPSATETEAEQPAPAGDAEEFGFQYYGLLPGDTVAAYELLSPSYGSSYEEYDGFWRTISAVDVRDVSVVDDTTIDVSITYTTNGGGVEDETRRLFLEPSGDSYVIVDDAAV